jgi:hypothetical protein
MPECLLLQRSMAQSQIGGSLVAQSVDVNLTPSDADRISQIT